MLPLCRSIDEQLQCGPITLAYKHRVNSGNVRLDNEQLSLSAAFDGLYSSLTTFSEQCLIVPDQHTEAAARYYGGASTPFGENFPGMAAANVRSMLAITRGKTKGEEKRGIYVHGSVGVGKSMIMDLFYSICAGGLSIPEDGVKYDPMKSGHRRCHFHEFMLDIHQRIHAHKAKHPRSDPIPPVAAALARDAKLLCFDEMQITDIADGELFDRSRRILLTDRNGNTALNTQQPPLHPFILIAMIIKRLLTILLDLGVIIVTTSNRPPSALYEGGINRSIFLPFIDTFEK